MATRTNVSHSVHGCETELNNWIPFHLHDGNHVQAEIIRLPRSYVFLLCKPVISQYDDVNYNSKSDGVRQNETLVMMNVCLPSADGIMQALRSLG